MKKERKKAKWAKKRHRIVVFLLRPIFLIYFKLKYKLKYKKYKLPKEGSIILANHTMTLDPFIVGVVFNKNLYYMTSKDLFQKKLVGKLIKFLVNPIPKEKSNKGDLASIKMCMQVAKENENICIFPEGNRTFSGNLGNIDSSIVKLVKLLKKPLIICNIKGGYASDPRWANKSRKGRVEVGVKKVITYDEYKDMDNDELYNLIIENLSINNFDLDINFRGKQKAENLEKILHICPVCNSEHTIYSKDNNVYCSSCNTVIEYQENLVLKSSNSEFKFKYICEWYDYQVQILKNREFANDEIIYKDDIQVYEPQLFKKKKLIGMGSVLLYNDCFKFSLDNEELILDFQDIYAITLVGKKKMNIYYKDKIYQIFNNQKTNLLKYMHVFYIIKNRKEGIENGFIGI